MNIKTEDIDIEEWKPKPFSTVITENTEKPKGPPLKMKNTENFTNNTATSQELQMHKCHICDKEFDQNGLEIHFLTYHNLENNTRWANLI